MNEIVIGHGGWLGANSNCLSKTTLSKQKTANLPKFLILGFNETLQSIFTLLARVFQAWVRFDKPQSGNEMFSQA
jgi:hypothetical protein